MKIYTCSSVGIDYFLFLGKTLRSCGFDVEDVFLISEAEYRRRAKSKGLAKLVLRIRMYVVYPCLLFKKALKAKKNDMFIVTSNTFYAPLIINLLLRNKVRLINLVYDLFPDAIEVSGKIKSNSILSKVIGAITRKTLKCSDANVFLGELLKSLAIGRWGPDNKNIRKVIHISSDYEFFEDGFKSNSNTKSIVIHYGGQLGLMHDASSLVSFVQATINNYGSRNIEFSFNLSGANAHLIESQCQHPKVSVKQAIGSSVWRKQIKNYDIGLVSLSPSGASVCLPSKTYAMMGGGLAILAICPIWSDLAELVLGLDAGWVVNNSMYNSLSEIPKDNFINEMGKYRSPAAISRDLKVLIDLVLTNKSLIETKRFNAYHRVREEYGMQKIADDWKNLIEGVTDLTVAN